MFPFKDSRGIKIFPFWTITIIVVNIYVFFLELTSGSTDQFIRQYALISARINFADFQTLIPFITSQFVHGGFLHIGANMLFLWVFGDNVEERLGFLFFPLFYLVAGIMGGLAQYFVLPNSVIPMIGASGAVAGVLGAYYVMFPKSTVRTLIPIFIFPIIIDIPAAIILVYWFVIQVFNGISVISTGELAFGGIAYFAHIAGFVTGLITGDQLKR